MKIKKIIAVALVLALAMGAGAFAAPGNKLGMEALSMLYDGKSNCFVSPVSLAYALALTAHGAEGETRKELLAALEADDSLDIADLAEALENSGLKIANAAFADENKPIKPDYLEAIKAAFGAELFGLDAPESVNAWVKQHTDGLIDRLIDQFPANTVLLLLNAIAMDAEWAQPFDGGNTFKAKFNAPSGTIETDMMHGVFTAPYAEVEDIQLVRLDYKGGLYALIALPRDGDIARTLEFLSRTELSELPFELRSPESLVQGVLDAHNVSDECKAELREELENWFTGPEQWEVNLSLPRFDISTGASLQAVLEALGIKRAFDLGSAELNGISDGPLFISEVIQKVRVQVNEQGTRAAAATMVAAADGAMMFEQIPVNMTCDRPFVMLIVDNQSGAICFAGVVSEPGK